MNLGKLVKCHLMGENMFGMDRRQKIYVYEKHLDLGGGGGGGVACPCSRGCIHVYDHNIQSSLNLLGQSKHGGSSTKFV